jgi:hypothetical protein
VGAALVVPVAPARATAAAVSVTASGLPGAAIQLTSCTGAVRWRTLLTTGTTATSVGTVVPLDEGRMCIKVPAGVSAQITRTGMWVPGSGLGLVAISPLRQVDPAPDGTVSLTTGGEAAWVSAEPTASTRLAARRCSSAASASKSVTWFADATVEELQVVPLTTVDGVQRWCLRQAGVKITHVARFVPEAEAGLSTSVRRVTPTKPVNVPDGTRAVVVQARAPRGEVTVGVCRDGERVASRVVRASTQVSTVLIDVPSDATTGLSVCLTASSKAQVHLLGTFSGDAASRMTVTAPRRVATLRG